jgi:CBS domain-containing protein
VGPHETIAEAARYMTENSIGALVVLEQDHVVGIFTERDVMFRVVTMRLDPASTPVKDVMTPNPVCVLPTLSVDEAMVLVTERRFRHLPVVENGKLRGLISSGDLTRWVVRDMEQQIEDLNAYITDTQVHPSLKAEYS